MSKSINSSPVDTRIESRVDDFEVGIPLAITQLWLRCDPLATPVLGWGAVEQPPVGPTGGHDKRVNAVGVGNGL